MKHIVRILFLAVALVTGLKTVSAQTVHVDVIQKVPALPATATNYLEDPFRYFDILVSVFGAGNEGVEVFFDIDFSLNDESFYLRTRRGTVPTQSITLQNGSNVMTRETMLTQLRGRKETNVDFSKPLNAQLLPEGTYQLRLDVYLWSDQNNPARVPISDGYYPSYEICYSGSAPELVAPTTGAQLGMNGARVVTPNRKVNFTWTPVISNCSGRNPVFRYRLKVVKVLKGQNYQDAIKRNPTVFSTEVRNGTYALLDTLRDLKVHMESGSLYVAQVQAEQIKTTRSMDDFIIANDGNSQPMPFFWGSDDDFSDMFFGDMNGNPQGKSSRNYDVSVDEEEAEEGDEEEIEAGLTLWEGGVEEVSELDGIIEEMKEQYLAGFIQDATTVASLTEAYPDERKYVPTPKQHYVESDGYYTVPMTDDLEVVFMPARHESLKNVSYTIELYNYLDGDVDDITANEPLLSAAIKKVPENYNKMDSHELISHTFNGWGSQLKQGNLYYLQLSSHFTVDYWKYSIADTSFYVNDMLAEHILDTVSREFVEEELESSNGVFFQWGDDPKAPGIMAPQWTSPVDRTGDDIYAPANYALPASVPEVQMAKTFPVAWTFLKDVDEDDEVEYEVKVYELKPNQTLDEAIATNKVLVSRTVTDINQISENDTKFFKVFSPQKTYVMTLGANVDEDSYHFKNGNEALPIVFKIVK